ncbi:MAG TPA: hypothetical protein VHM90_12300, partial [Phycisphaerae bacterium]|nr:hypothetical protein [Phycisphaerae bacterium]
MRKYLLAATIAISCSSLAFAGGGGGGGGGFGGGGAGGGGFGGGGRGGFGGGLNVTQQQVSDLSADETTKITAITTELGTKMQAWQTSSNEALMPLRGQPGTPLDAAGQQKLNDETAKQNALRDDMNADAEIKILAVLTPAQGEKWEAARLTQQAVGAPGAGGFGFGGGARFATLGLSADQTTKINAMIADAAKKISAAKDKGALAKAKAEF